EDLSLVRRGPGEAPPLRGERAGPGHGEESRAGRPARALRGRLLPPRLRGAVRPRHVDLADDSLPRVQEVPPGAAGRGRAHPLPLPRHRLCPAPAGQGLGHAHRPRRGCRPVRDGALLPHPVFRGAPLPHPCRRTDRRGFKRPDLQRLEDLPVRPCKEPHARRVQRREPCHGGGERDEVRRSLLVRRIGRPRRPGVRGRRGMVHEGRDARDRGLRLLRLPSLLRRGHDPRAGRGLRRGGRPQGGRAMKGSPEPARRLAVVLSHPTQYYSPWFRWLRSRTALDFHVFYLWDFGVAPRRDPQFGTSFEWDVDLLSGYDCEFVPNMSAKPGADRFFGFRNPGLPRRLSALGPDALLLFGYKWASHLRAVAWARRKGVPILFRGDSHLLGRGSPRLHLRLALGALYSQFACFLYAGAANREYFEALGVPRRKLFFAPHSVNAELFNRDDPGHIAQAQRVRSELGLKPTTRVVLFAGKLVEAKQPVELLQAFLDARLE